MHEAFGDNDTLEMAIRLIHQVEQGLEKITGRTSVGQGTEGIQDQFDQVRIKKLGDCITLAH